jgi:hypothetical protein
MLYVIWRETASIFQRDFKVPRLTRRVLACFVGRLGSLTEDDIGMHPDDWKVGIVGSLYADSSWSTSGVLSEVMPVPVASCWQDTKAPSRTSGSASGAATVAHHPDAHTALRLSNG